MKLRFTPRAVANILEIADYIRARNLAAADAIYQSLQDLILFPKSGRRQKMEGVRKLVTRKYPYFVYYSIDEEADGIIILNVAHASRRREHSDA